MIQKVIEHTEIPLGSYALSRSTVFLVTLTKKIASAVINAGSIPVIY